MSRTAVRNSVNWVDDFGIEDVSGNPNEIHDELSRLEKLIVEQLPFTDAKVAADYGKKLERLKIASLELYDVTSRLREINNGELELAKSKYDVVEQISKLMQQIENEEIEDDEELVQEVESLYEESVKVFEGRDEVEQRELDDYNRIFDYILNLSDSKESLKKDVKSLTKERNDLIYQWQLLEKETVGLKNDVRTIQENTSKAIEEESRPSYKTTFRAQGKEEIKIDHAASSVARKEDKAKKFTENFVFANLTFVVEINGEKSEITLPIKIQNEGVVNLSRFKPSEHMSLSLGRSYDSSSDYLRSRIKDRYVKGLKVMGREITKDSEEMQLSFYRSDNFSHSEQALFSALLEDANLRKRLAKDLVSNFEDPSQVKVIGMALDLHTSRYMCDCCSISALGFQDNSANQMSFKNLMVKTLRSESKDLVIDPATQIHIRASASVDFQVKPKTLSEHTDQVSIESAKISQKDIRSDQEKPPYQRDHLTPYRSGDISLLKSLNEHTLFTSGDVEEQRLKTAYARALRPLLEKAASTIQEGLRPLSVKKLSSKVAATSIAEK